MRIAITHPVLQRIPHAAPLDRAWVTSDDAASGLPEIAARVQAMQREKSEVR